MKSKWLISATYKPPSLSKEKFFGITCNDLDAYGKTYDNVILTGDFSYTEQDEDLIEFLEDNKLSNLVKFLTCFKNAENPSTIDLINTNQPKQDKYTMDPG